MATNSQIEWTDHTFNPWEGCQKVGPGCDHCYAEARNARYGGGIAPNWGPGAPRRRTSAANWAKPRRWRREAFAFQVQHGRRQRVFCASLADVFDNAVDPAWRVELFDLIRDTPELDWLLLTKRIGNAAAMLPDDWGDGWPHVWLGATVVNQVEADRDIPKLLNTPAAVRFISAEPLLGPVDFTEIDIAHACGTDTHDALTGCYAEENGGQMFQHTGGSRLDWIICGGESGPGARPMHPDWARSLRDQCQAAGVPFFMKQWGEYLYPYDRDRDDPDWRQCGEIERQTPNGRWVNLEGGQGFHGERVVRAMKVGKKAAGHTLDGEVHHNWPEVKA